MPSQPVDSCGMSVSGAGWSRPPETRCGSAAVPSDCELGLAELAEVGSPEHDDGERGVAGVEDDARSSVAEVDEPGAALHGLFLRQK